MIKILLKFNRITLFFAKYQNHETNKLKFHRFSLKIIDFIIKNHDFSLGIRGFTQNNEF